MGGDDAEFGNLDHDYGKNDPKAGGPDLSAANNTNNGTKKNLAIEIDENADYDEAN